MTRASFVTRTTGTARDMPDPRVIGPPFWSAMVMSNTQADIDPGSSSILPTNQPRHATNGDSDFDDTDYPVLKLIVPFDGVYGVNAYVVAHSPGTATGSVRIVIATDSSGPDIGTDYRRFPADDTSVALEASRVGFPLIARTRIWVYANNSTDQTLATIIDHLEATYFGPLGTLYPIEENPET